MRILYVLLFMALVPLHGQQTIFLKKGYDTMVLFETAIDGEIHLGNDLEYDAEKISDRVLKLSIINKPMIKPTSGTTCSVFSGGKLYNFDIRLTTQDKIKNVVQADPTKTHTIVPNTSLEKEGNIFTKIASVDKPKNDNEYRRVVSNCKNNEKRKRKIYSTYVKSNNILLSLYDIAHQGNKIYLFLELHNKGWQDYNVEWVNLYVTTNDLPQELSFQKKLFPSYYIHNTPKNIKGKRKYSFVVVFEKNPIDQYKAVEIDLKELKGERDLTLNIKDETINNPNRF